LPPADCIALETEKREFLLLFVEETNTKWSGPNESRPGGYLTFPLLFSFSLSVAIVSFSPVIGAAVSHDR
jgi:hypothetical protein